MDAIVVVEAEYQNVFQQDLEKYVRLGYVIVHCNSFLGNPSEVSDMQFSGIIRYTAVLQLQSTIK
jgi:hypothetical protein